MLNYVPHVPSRPTCFTCLRFVLAFILLRTFIFLRALGAFIFLRALRAFIFLRALSALISFRALDVSIILRDFIFYVSFMPSFTSVLIFYLYMCL